MEGNCKVLYFWDRQGEQDQKANMCDQSLQGQEWIESCLQVRNDYIQ